MENESTKNKGIDPITLDSVEDCYKHIHKITGELSRGGQGVVLKTKDPETLIKLALKDNSIIPIGDNDNSNDQYMALRLLPISSKQHVTLPLATIKNYEGYVMRMLGGMCTFHEGFELIVDQEGRSATKWMQELPPEIKERIESYYFTGGERRRMEAYMKSGTLLAQLHAKGLVYCDYSNNNVFISKDIEHCNVWLIDADNLKEETKAIEGYVFTPGIAAPEIVQYDIECRSNVPQEECCGCGNTFSSDTYTYAYCLFKCIMEADPFDGNAYKQQLNNCDDRTEIDEQKDRGEFSYVDDSDDNSNLDDFVQQCLCIRTTRGLQELFRQTFGTAGKTCRWLRPTMFEYAEETARCLDLLVRCCTCGMEHVMYTFENGVETAFCPWCDAPMKNIILLKSYFYEGDKKSLEVWEYAHELSEEECLVPLRLVNGYIADELDQKLLKLSLKGSKLYIGLTGNVGDIKMSFSDDGNKFNYYPAVETSAKRFWLRISNNIAKQEYFLEGEVVG